MMRARAVTLVELAAVIAITLILTASAVAGLVGMQQWQRAAALRRVQADLAHARDLAILSSRRTLIVLHASPPSYEVQQEADPGSGAISGSALTHPLTGEPWVVAPQDLGGGLTLAWTIPGGATSFGFAADGRPVSAAGVPLAADVQATANNGAEVIVRDGSGVSEVNWP